MKNFGTRQPLVSKANNVLPRDLAPLTATSKNAQPAVTDLFPKAPETGDVPGYSMIVVVALNHAPQPFPDCRQRLMHTPPKFVLHLLQFGEESLSDGFA